MRDSGLEQDQRKSEGSRPRAGGSTYLYRLPHGLCARSVYRITRRDFKMGALIVLHGLFLLHCNETSKRVGKLNPQYCEILTADMGSHVFRVGGGPNFVELPPSLNLMVTLNPTSGRDPD